MRIMFNKLFFSAVFVFVLSLFVTPIANAQTTAELHNDYQGTYRAEVLEIVSSEMQDDPLSNLKTLSQKIKAKVLDGPQKGLVIETEDDFLHLEKGDVFYFNYNKYIDGTESYDITNIDRRGALLLLGFLFVAVILLFGRWQGLRSLLALFGSFAIIAYVLLPGILNGWNPLLASFIVASGILFMAIFFTHGFNRESVVAYSGTMLAVALSGLFALFAVHITSLTGFASDESTYLNINTGGTLNFTALLLGAFIIGFLGVLDDIAITQAAVVTELFNSNHKISRREVYRRAMRVGREHVGALVNTLVLAYTGASLPLLLYFKLGNSTFDTTVNMELFATEVVRTIVGSIGLVLTVPIVTLLAVRYLKGYKPKGENSHSHGHV